MEIIISEGSDPRVWPFVVAAAVLILFSVACIWMAFGDREMAEIYGRLGDHDKAAAAKRRAKWLFLVPIPLLLLSIVTFVVSYKVGTEENSTQYETMTTTFYESFGVANITLGEAFPGHIPDRLVCAEGEPPAKDRPYSEASWINDDGSYSEGVLVNMGNVDGECRFTLTEK